MRLLTAILSSLVLAAYVSATETVPRGLYLELYYGYKSGGGEMHHELLEKLRQDKELMGFTFFCIKGLSRTADSDVPGYAIDRERRLPPVITKQCKGSAAILMGPVQGENIQALENHLSSTYLHLYSNLRLVQ